MLKALPKWRTKYLAWAKKRYADQEALFMWAVEEYRADSTWARVDEIFSVYLGSGVVDIGGYKPLEELRDKIKSLKKDTSMPNPPKELFDGAYGWTMTTLINSYDGFLAEGQ
jgi:hypothetical protein